MDTKKYDVMMPIEGNHYSGAENEAGNSTSGPPQVSFEQRDSSSMLENFHVESQYSNLDFGKFGTAMSAIDAGVEVAKAIKTLYGEVKYQDEIGLHIAAIQVTSKALQGSPNEEGVSYFEWSVGFDKDGYAHYESTDGGSIRDADGASPHVVNLGNKSISRASLGNVREAGRQAVRDFNTAKMIKDFKDKAEGWGKGDVPIYDYRDVPATSGSWPSGGGGSSPKNNKPKHIV